MKKIILALGVLMTMFHSSTASIAGGDLRMWTDTVEGRQHIFIELLLVADTNGPALGSYVNLQVYFNEVYEGNHAVILKPGTGVGNTLCQKGNSVFNLYVYESSFVAPATPERVRVQLNRCCRIPADNFFQTMGFYLSASYDMHQGPNQKFDIKTPFALFSNVGDTIAINHLTNEYEGDSLWFSVDTPQYWSQGAAHAVNNYGHPVAAASGMFQIHPQNGLLTWIPSGGGTFSYRIKIEEYRFDSSQGQHFKIAEHNRDIITVASLDLPGYDFQASPLSGFQSMEKGIPVYEVMLGQTANIQMDFSQVDTSDFSLSAHDGPFDFDSANTSMTISYPSTNQVNCALTWQTVGQYSKAGPHFFTIRVTQNCVVYDILLAMKLLGPIGIVEKEITAGKIFPNPSQNGNVVIQSDLLKNRNCQISISSLAGQKVHQVSPGQTSDGRFEIQPNLPTGTYLIRISDREKVQYFKWVRE